VAITLGTRVSRVLHALLVACESGASYGICEAHFCGALLCKLRFRMQKALNCGHPSLIRWRTAGQPQQQTRHEGPRQYPPAAITICTS
jgi:hypothetical protein